MNEIQTFLDSLQAALNSGQSLWNQVSGILGSIFGGNDTIGGIVGGLILLAAVGGMVYAANNIFGG